MSDVAASVLAPLSLPLVPALAYFTATNVAAGVLLLGAQPFNPGSPPVLSNIVPPEGTVLSAGSPVQFDVTDDTGLAFVAVLVRQGSAYDVVHDGINASPRYGVTISAITGGRRYIIQPVGGWTAPPTFVVRALDTGGQLG